MSADGHEPSPGWVGRGSHPVGGGHRGRRLPAGAGRDHLGIVGGKRFAGRIGRNEAFNHAGSAMSAATAQGRGAALSAGLAGLLIVHAGYAAAFLVLAGVAAVGFALYWRLMPETAPDRVGAR